MWRSKARALKLVIQSARRVVSASPPSIQTVISTTNSSVLHQSPCLSVPIFQTHRFFSQHSNPIDPNPLSDETSLFISQETDLEIENPNLFSLEDAPEIEPLSQEDSIEGGELNTLSPEDGEEGVEGEEEEEEEGVEETDGVEVEQVQKVLSLLQSSLDESLESTLDNMDLNVNEEFVVKILETPFVPGESLIAFFKWALAKEGFSVNTRVVDCLVRAVSTSEKKMEAYALWDLVKEIGGKEIGVLSTEILNELISLFWKLGKGKAGLEVFDKFVEFGCERYEDSYYLTIEVLCKKTIFESAWSVCEKMLNAGKLPDGEKIGNILSCLCRGSKAKDAQLVYLMAKEKNKIPPRSTVNFLINSLCREDATVKLALELVEGFKGDECKYAIKPFSSVIRGLCRIKEVEEAKKLLHKMIQDGPPPGNAVFNSVICGFSKAGELKEAKNLMRVMESRGLKPDVYTYTVIISGYAKGGQMEEALKVLSEAKVKHAQLNPVTYHTLIRGYCKLEEFDKALELLNDMKESGVKPNADEYNKLIQSLCLKALDWRTAEELFKEMREKGMYLNGMTRGLIKAVKEMEEQELNAEEKLLEA